MIINIHNFSLQDNVCIDMRGVSIVLCVGYLVNIQKRIS